MTKDDSMPEIQVSATHWNEVSDSDRQKIIEGFRSMGLLTNDDKLVPSDEISAEGWNPIKDLCKIACDAAAASAVAWCTVNTAGAATALCIAAAEALREKCRDRC